MILSAFFLYFDILLKDEVTELQDNVINLIIIQFQLILI